MLRNSTTQEKRNRVEEVIQGRFALAIDASRSASLREGPPLIQKMGDSGGRPPFPVSEDDLKNGRAALRHNLHGYSERPLTEIRPIFPNIADGIFQVPQTHWHPAMWKPNYGLSEIEKEKAFTDIFASQSQILNLIITHPNAFFFVEGQAEIQDIEAIKKERYFNEIQNLIPPNAITELTQGRLDFMSEHQRRIFCILGAPMVAVMAGIIPRTFPGDSEEYRALKGRPYEFGSDPIRHRYLLITKRNQTAEDLVRRHYTPGFEHYVIIGGSHVL